jgi:diguanylate cyclase (GGDEF)-like protein/PAS domain S-box-containing protein
MATLDVRALTLLSVNPAFAQLHGGQAAHFQGTPLAAQVAPEMLPHLPGAEQLAREGRAAYSAEHLRADGTRFVVDAELVVIRDQQGVATSVVGSFRDTTALRVEVDHAQARTQAVLDHSPMAIFLRDLDGRWLSVNQRLASILGHSAQDLEGRGMALTHDADDETRFAADDLQILTDGVAREFDVTFADASRGGEHRHFWLQKFAVLDRQGQPIGLGGISLDVTDREGAQRDLLVERERFAAAFEHAPVGKVISRLQVDGTSSQVIRCNPAFAQMLGLQPQDVTGRAGVMLTHPDDLAARDWVIREARDGRRARVELRLRHEDGHYVWVLVAPVVIQDADGRPEMIIQTVDITERKALEDRLRQLADEDSLTGLLARRGFGEQLQRELARVRRHGGCAGLLLLDLDGFKEVNDTLGHSAGDDLLILIAAAMRRVLRISDVIGRIGGDEFAILLPQTNPQRAAVVGAKLLAAVRAHGHVQQGNHRALVTASIGVTALDATTTRGPDELLAEADAAMYQAKAAGRDRVASHVRPSPSAGP